MSLFAVQFDAARRRANEEQPAKRDPERPTGPAFAVTGREDDAAQALDAAHVLWRITRDPQLVKDIIASLCKNGVIQVRKDE